MSIVIGTLAWVVLFVCAATLLHEPGLAYWGAFFIAVCGFTLGIAVSRIGEP